MKKAHLKSELSIRFSTRLIQLRDKKGESQKDLADLLNVNQQTISKYESGDSIPNIESFKILADHFGVSYDYLIGDSENKKIENVEIGKYLGLNDSSIEILHRLALDCKRLDSPYYLANVLINMLFGKSHIHPCNLEEIIDCITGFATNYKYNTVLGERMHELYISTGEQKAPHHEWNFFNDEIDFDYVVERDNAIEDISRILIKVIDEFADYYFNNTERPVEEDLIDLFERKKEKMAYQSNRCTEILNVLREKK